MGSVASDQKYCLKVRIRGCEEIIYKYLRSKQEYYKYIPNKWKDQNFETEIQKAKIRNNFERFRNKQRAVCS